MPGIFISYRRDDAAGHAGALLRELNQRFGSQNIFMDIEDIRGGQDFVQTLGKALDDCDVLIALIGPHWLDMADARGTRRIEDPNDYVRLEISTALERGVRVIPLLTEGTAIPGADRLPEGLKGLATRNAMQIRNATWDHDVDRLADEIRTAMYSPERSGRAAQPLLPANFDPGPLMSGKIAAFTAVALLIGLLFLGIGLFQGIQTRGFLSRAKEATGRVVEVVPDADGNYHSVVEYENSAGQSVTFRSAESSRPASHQVGDEVAILVDPQNADNVKLKSFFSLWGLATIFSLIGGIFCAIAAGMLVAALVRRRHQRDLIRTGRPIMTSFDRVEVNTRLKFNERHPYQIVTRWHNPLSNELVYFRSTNVWDDPTEYVKHRAITVLVDPNNFSRYVMDLSILQEPTKRN